MGFKGNTGYIVASELKMVLNSLGLKLTVKEVDEMVKFADVENDGQISYEEFARMMPSIWYYDLFIPILRLSPSIFLALPANKFVLK